MLSSLTPPIWTKGTTFSPLTLTQAAAVHGRSLALEEEMAPRPTRVMLV
ncbi:hypothetical protein Pcinc_032433, partial [Petrolisthes cinctipes]